LGRTTGAAEFEAELLILRTCSRTRALASRVIPRSITIGAGACWVDEVWTFDRADPDVAEVAEVDRCRVWVAEGVMKVEEAEEEEGRARRSRDERAKRCIVVARWSPRWGGECASGRKVARVELFECSGA
jgi:hypothetical protein